VAEQLGYHRVQVQLGRANGVSSQESFTHFADKEQLFVDLVVAITQTAEEVLEAVTRTLLAADGTYDLPPGLVSPSGSGRRRPATGNSGRRGRVR
jgi:hypothetical protein